MPIPFLRSLVLRRKTIQGGYVGTRRIVLRSRSPPYLNEDTRVLQVRNVVQFANGQIKDVPRPSGHFPACLCGYYVKTPGSRLSGSRVEPRRGITRGARRLTQVSPLLGPLPTPRRPNSRPASRTSIPLATGNPSRIPIPRPGSVAPPLASATTSATRAVPTNPVIIDYSKYCVGMGNTTIVTFYRAGNNSFWGYNGCTLAGRSFHIGSAS